jgi:hypothetical protein
MNQATAPVKPPASLSSNGPYNSPTNRHTGTTDGEYRDMTLQGKTAVVTCASILEN